MLYLFSMCKKHLFNQKSEVGRADTTWLGVQSCVVISKSKVGAHYISGTLTVFCVLAVCLNGYNNGKCACFPEKCLILVLCGLILKYIYFFCLIE